MTYYDLQRLAAYGILETREGVMMPRKSPYHVVLSPEQRAKLEALARAYTSPYRDVIRAKIALYAADGLDNDEIAARLDTARQIVSKWRKRYFEEGFPGLEERPRRGRPARFSPQNHHRG